MEYNSFYGGRKGSSFAIARVYTSIAEMIADFKLGDGCKSVGFDEYVIINTASRNNPDNGKIYRRGYEYTNSNGGAIYSGQVQGPDGLAPEFILTTINDVLSKQQMEGFDYRINEGSYSVANGNLVPGKSGNTYNDAITWASCSVRDEYGIDTAAYVGFKFPYHVTEFEAESTTPYQESGLITRTDNQNHPFYSKWKIAVPKGKNGDCLKNIRVITANSSIENYDGKSDDITNNRKVIVGDYYDYSESATPTPKVIYIGDYNMINSVSSTTDGKLIFELTHDNQKEVALNSVINTAINGQYHLLVYYSDERVRNQIIAQGKDATYNNLTGWHDLGYIGNGTGTQSIIGKEDDENIIAIANRMPPYSSWFVVED